MLCELGNVTPQSSFFSYETSMLTKKTKPQKEENYLDLLSIAIFRFLHLKTKMKKTYIKRLCCMQKLINTRSNDAGCNATHFMSLPNELSLLNNTIRI